MTDGYPQRRRETLEGLVETAYLLATRSVEEGEDLEDVREILNMLREVLEGKDGP